MPKFTNFLRIAIFLFFIFPFLFLTSCKSVCSKKTPCPGYEDILLDSWFPYANNQQLVFKSNNNLTDTLLMQLTDSTIAYDYTNGFSSSSTGCNADKGFNAAAINVQNNPGFSLTLSSSLDAYSTTKKESVYIYFDNIHFLGQDLRSGGFSSFSINNVTAVPQSLTNYSLNGVVYPVAQTVFADTLAMKITGVYKITFAKNYGIIAYETNPGNIVWSKQ